MALLSTRPLMTGCHLIRRVVLLLLMLIILNIHLFLTLIRRVAIPTIPSCYCCLDICYFFSKARDICCYIVVVCFHIITLTDTLGQLPSNGIESISSKLISVECSGKLGPPPPPEHSEFSEHALEHFPEQFQKLPH